MVATDLTELEASADMLRRRASQLQKLTLELAHAEERERRRISRILHDDLQQNLAALKLRLSLILASASLNERTRRGMHEFGKVLEESIEATRNLSRELSPPLLPQNNLLSALEWLAASVKQRHGLEVTLESSSEAEPSFPAIASLLFQSVRELLFNIVKHSGVTSAHVSAQAVEDRISLIVSDHGRGFDLAAWRANRLSGSGIGLVGIEERINALGGHVEIESSPAQGCVVRLVMPRHAGLETVERPEVAVEPVMAGLAGDGMLQPPTEQHSSRRIRILLADDHTAMREGLASILRSEGDLEIVGQAADGIEAVRMAVDLYPDIILMDVSMPGMDGIKATIEVTKYLTHTRVIGLSMHEDPGISRSMREAGACAYLSKSSSPEEIVRAVRGALSH
jgi:CheY-like chemotaxis protein